MYSLFKKSKGFTLLEIVVSIGIFVIIVVIIMGIFASFVKSERTILRSQELQREGAAALERIARDVRDGGRPFTYYKYANTHLLLFKREGLNVADLQGKEKYQGKKEGVMYIADDARGLVRRKCPDFYGGVPAPRSFDADGNPEPPGPYYFDKCVEAGTSQDEIVIPAKYFKDPAKDIIIRQNYRTNIILKLDNNGEKLILQTTVLPGYGQGGIDLDYE